MKILSKEEFNALNRTEFSCARHFNIYKFKMRPFATNIMAWNRENFIALIQKIEDQLNATLHDSYFKELRLNEAYGYFGIDTCREGELNGWTKDDLVEIGIYTWDGNLIRNETDFNNVLLVFNARYFYEEEHPEKGRKVKSKKGRKKKMEKTEIGYTIEHSDLPTPKKRIIRTGLANIKKHMEENDIEKVESDLNSMLDVWAKVKTTRIFDSLMKQGFTKEDFIEWGLGSYIDNKEEK